MLCILGVVTLIAGLLGILAGFATGGIAATPGAMLFVGGVLMLAMDSAIDQLKAIRKDLARYGRPRAAEEAPARRPPRPIAFGQSRP